MSGRAPGPSNAHLAVQRELLVRYLDTWAPAALHGNRPSIYVETYSGAPPADPPVLAAVRVFAEFPELLARHPLTVLVVTPEPATRLAFGDLPKGLTVRVDSTFERPKRGIVFVHAIGDGPPPDVGDAEVLHAGPHPVERDGSPYVADVDLVDTAGTVLPLRFRTGSAKHLAAYKEALWAVDEYAGVRYRDPGDPEHALVDISLNPPVGPLRRAMADRLARGACTVAELREYALRETIYQPADADRVLTGLLKAGGVARTPDRGRLTADTVIRHAGRHAA